MATFVAVPLKKTWEVDLQKPIRTFIADVYANSDPEENNRALLEFDKLRQSMINKSVDKHESALEVLYRYYDQLCAIESKFPIAENQIRINFKWQDAFDKESFFSGKRTLAISTSGYEKVCLLFNIAALQSQVADSQNHTSDEGLKSSAKLFAQSCGIFNYLKDGVLSHVQNDPTPDLHPDTLNALGALMLAQSQDCFVRKAIQDKMKPAIVAKLAHQCSDLYAESMKLLQLDSIRSFWPKEWISSVAGKQASYHALAEYYQSLLNKAAKEFGEEIARLKHARELMQAAESRGAGTFIFHEHGRKINKGLEEALKDNDFIYHAKVPEKSAIPAIGKAPLAKPAPLAAPMSSNFKDLFQKVVPLAVHQAMGGFEQRKAGMVNMEVGRLREATNLMNSVLASLNLPAAIEDLGGTRAPQSLLEKGEKMRQMGGITYLGRLTNELPELLQRNKEILDEAEKGLNEEEQSDKQLRQQFKERWTRTSSDKLTGPIRAEATKYRTIINNAMQADGIVKERYNQHKEGINILSKSDADIERSLPSGAGSASLQGAPVVVQLKGLMEHVATITAEREVMERELKDTECDLSSKFMSALAQDGAIDEESLSAGELERMYAPLRRQVSESCSRQEALLAQVQNANTEFVQSRSGSGGMSREEKLKELAAAYDSFVELKNNLEEGTKFYNDLTQLLVKFQSKANDFCFARKTEKEELMKDLQTNIVRQTSAPPPVAPSYQQPTVTGSGKREPPARPPPPEPSARAPPPKPPRAAPAVPSQPPAPAAASAPPGGYTQPHGHYPHSGVAPAGYPPAASPGGNLPYPMYPPYMPAPPMPTGYNPYAAYGYPPQVPQQGGYAPPPPTQGYPGYPGYPPQQQQQQWPR